MTTYYLNGTIIPEGSNITLSGFTYPYSWLEGTSASIRAAHGIQKTGDSDTDYDPRYYSSKDIVKNLEDREEVDEQGNPAYVKVWDSVAKEMIDSDKRVVTKGLKTNCIAEVKNSTNNLLNPTDFYIIRNSVENVEIPTSVSEYRAAVIAEQNRVVAAITATTTVEGLIEVMQSITWPKAE